MANNNDDDNDSYYDGDDAEVDDADNADDADDADGNDNQHNAPPVNNIQNEKVIEFIGSINEKVGWIKCLYCDRYHPHSMHLTGMEYCGHCWAWLNVNQLDLEKGIYTGHNPISEIKKYIGETFKLHDQKKCTMNECVYKKIIDFKNNKKLHIDFCVELGFTKKPEPLNVVDSSILTPISTLTNLTNSTNNKINKKTNIKINYKLSHITI